VLGEETPYWDTLVFSKIKARFGGRIRLIVSGSAPLSPTVQHFLKVYANSPLPLIAVCEDRECAHAFPLSS
jgi:hypothetical protein